jgi:hypothetical protein
MSLSIKGLAGRKQMQGLVKAAVFRSSTHAPEKGDFRVLKHLRTVYAQAHELAGKTT